MMTEQEAPRIERADLSKYPRPVADLVMHLVNSEGVRYKVLDGDHLVLYSPDGVQRPFKIASKRPAEDQVGYIERRFMHPNDIPGPDGVVPGTQGRPVETVRLTDGVLSTHALESPQIAPLVPGATEALKALAASLGLTVDGGVSEEDYLAVVAEKDLLAASLADMTRHRDELLARAQNLEDDIAQACAMLARTVKS